ncbi:MAG: patatin-like phospholipase family protein [Spirochaetes bacterium]|nr:patatin-like phospholipase family protein [Spirochaetota bacterium]
MVYSQFRSFAFFCCLLVFSQMATTQAATEDARPRVALVLAGGGALGLAHIGVIKVLEELGMPIDIVIGTSMGAVVGGFYAQGFDAPQLEKIALEVDWPEMLNEHMSSSEERFRSRIDRSRYFASIDFDRRGLKIQGSLLTGRKLLYFLDRTTIAVPASVDFDALPRQYRAVSVDLATGQRVVIAQGSMADVMRASMGIPGLLAPHLIGGQYLIDGGVVDNLPISTARELGADLIIAVDLIGGIPFSPTEFDRNPLDALYRSIDIMIRSNVARQLPDADLLLSVDLAGYQATDFKDAVEIMKRGEDTARGQLSDLELFKSKLGIQASYFTDIRSIQQTAIEQVRVLGGSTKNQAQAYALFSQFIGTIPDELLLEKAVGTLEDLGIYDYIRVQRNAEGASPTLSVSLTKRVSAEHSLNLGLKYTSTYSASTLSKMSLSPGIVLRGLTTDDSRLSVNLHLLDSPGVEASFVQPLGPQLFAELFFSAAQKSMPFTDGSNTSYLYETNTLDCGFNVGLNPFKWMELSLGLSFQWMNSTQPVEIITGDIVPAALMAHALFMIHNFDTAVFPNSGAGFNLYYDTALPGAWGARNFHTLNAEGLVIPTLKLPFSIAIWAKAGSDFSKFADGPIAAPLEHKPDISNRQFLPGPHIFLESFGSHIAGLGNEIKYQIPWASQTIGLPSFLLAQFAAASVLQNLEDIAQLPDFTHWNAALGVGIRLNEGFGISLRIGALLGFSKELSYFMALDLGSIGF